MPPVKTPAFWGLRFRFSTSVHPISNRAEFGARLRRGRGRARVGVCEQLAVGPSSSTRGRPGLKSTPLDSPQKSMSLPGTTKRNGKGGRAAGRSQKESDEH